jgi:hypothetical protein
VPVLLALGISLRDRDAHHTNLDTLWIVLAVGAGLAQLASFAQGLRRNTVGYDGALSFLWNPVWDPPVPPLLLATAFVVVVAAYTAWLVGPAMGADAPAVEMGVGAGAAPIRVGSRSRDR